MNDSVETIEYRGHDINIFYDEDGTNPRTDCDNADVMFFQHRRYTLGDKDAEDPFEEVTFYELDGIRMEEREQEQAYFALRAMADAEADLDTQLEEAVDALRLDCEEVTERRLRSDIAICLPVMMYDHSGITIWHGSQNPAQDSAGWDSGLIGFHYITKEAVEKEWKDDLEAAQRCMEATLKMYDSYLRGDVYGYVIDEDGDSCWGFIGSDYEESGLLESAHNAVDCLVADEDKAKDIEMMECGG